MRKKLTPKLPVLTAGCGLLACLPAQNILAAEEPSAPSKTPTSSVETRLIPFDANLFRADPNYGDKPYDPNAQIDIYGNKHAVISTRPLIELGRELFQEGPFQPAPSVLGRKNLIFQRLYVYGDVRAATGFNDNANANNRHATAAFRADLDVDYQFTATERVHAFFRPFEKDGALTRINYGGGQNNHGEYHLDGTPLALFFEGDAGRILEGFSGSNNHLDMPIAAGLMPLVIQNGVWLQSAFTGVAFTIPARNCPVLKISNMDATFFAGFDRVNTAAVKPPQGTFNAKLFGVATFIEALQGYWEADYGYTEVDPQFSGQSYHNFSLAYTRRYFDRVSNSLRIIYNTGQNPQAGKTKTADGVLLLMENSFVTHDEVSLVPYANFFLGFHQPQSLARDAGAGGVLVNTGLNFETDALTQFPKLDDRGMDTYGGAIGCEYLFGLSQQLVLEAATVQIRRDNIATGGPRGAQYAIGARYQIPLTRSLIFRTDGILAKRNNDRDIGGVRVELRYKF